MKVDRRTRQLKFIQFQDSLRFYINVLKQFVEACYAISKWYDQFEHWIILHRAHAMCTVMYYYLWFEKIAPKILLFASVKSFSRYNIFALKNQITFRTVNEYHWLSFFSNYCLEIKNSLIARRTKTIFLLLTALSFSHVFHMFIVTYFRVFFLYIIILYILKYTWKKIAFKI